jgi:hypothetical protein
MTTKFVTATWVGAVILLLALSINGLSATLGWHISINSPITWNDERRSTTAWAPVYFALWCLSETAVLVLCFELLRRHRKSPPWLRLPSIAGMPDSIADPFSRRLHKGLILVIVAGPLYAGGHFLAKTLAASVECAGRPVVRAWPDHFLAAPTCDRCWLDGPERGVQFYPPWEGWAFLVCYVAIMSFWVRALHRLTKKARSG